MGGSQKWDSMRHFWSLFGYEAQLIGRFGSSTRETLNVEMTLTFFSWVTE